MKSDKKKEIVERMKAVQTERMTRLYPPGSSLFRRGQRPSGVFYLEHGSVDLLGFTTEPKRVNEGDVLGLTELFTGKRYDVHAVCNSMSRVIYVEKDELFAN